MNIIGHQKILKLLEKAISKNSINQAYLFSGPEQVGKFTIALDFAQKLAGEDGQKNGNIIVIEPEIEPARNATPARNAVSTAGWRSVAGGEKPVRSGKGTLKKRDIKIEQIRDLQHQLNLSAQAGKHKVAIIDGAERLNKAAQNALLKTLEEANESVVLILICQNEKKMLPTILSRCQRIKFGTVADSELEKHIINIKNLNDILFWSLGRPGLMLELQKNAEMLEFRQETTGSLQKLCAQNMVEKFALAEEMAKDIELSIKKLDLWTVILREILLGQKTNVIVSAKKALKILDGLGRTSELLKTTNSNARLVLENLFLDF